MQQPEAATHRYQSALAAYCRTGRYEEIPGVRSRHVNQYRRLVFNVVEDMLRSAYPLTHHLLSDTEWEGMVQDFFSAHPCQSPQVWYMPKELYEYLQQEDHPLLKKYPFLSALLWFEWLEVELFMMEDQPALYSTAGDIQVDSLVLNPEHHLQHFEYPVHIKQARQISEADKGNYFLVLFRKPGSGDVAFMQLSPALVSILELLQEGPQRLDTLISEACARWQLPLTAEIREAVLDFITQALDNHLILGFTSKP